MASNRLYQVNQLIEYQYSEPPSSVAMSLCLQPRSTNQQRLVDFDIHTSSDDLFSTDTDYFGNTHHLFYHHHQFKELVVECTSIVDSSAKRPSLEQGITWDQISADALAWSRFTLTQPTETTLPTQRLISWADSFESKSNASAVLLLKRLEERIHQEFEYKNGATDVHSTVDDVLSLKQGVCQDFTHLMLATARHWGIASRYVSGFLREDPDQEHKVAERAMHAWVECHLPTIGWVSFDPTNPEAEELDRILVAVGRDYHDVAPTRGVTMGGGEEELHVDVKVEQLAVDAI